MDKVQIRNEILEKRNNLSKEFVEKNSEIIVNKLCNIIEKNNFQNIMIFMDMKNEVKVTRLIDIYPNKNFYIPKTFPKGIIKVNKYDKNSLVKHKFGYLESNSTEFINENILDLIIVSGIVFDKSKNRIGFGGGYYDRFLAKIKENHRNNNFPLIVATCYDFQILSNIPTEIHDQKPNLIVSEERILL